MEKAVRFYTLTRYVQNIVKCGQYYKKIFHTKITSISKLRIILRNNYFFPLTIQRDRKQLKTGLQIANSQFIYLILNFLIKKVIIIFFKYLIFKY